MLFGGPAARSEDDIDNEKLSDIMRCLICLKMPVYPKECSECSILLCDTCLIKYVKIKGRNMPLCPHCKTTNVNAFRDVQSNLLREIIDNIKVGHKCKMNQKQLDIYSIGQLKRHVEAGDCPSYNLKCFCGSLDKFSLQDLKKHIREECEMVRLQCKYCHHEHNYGQGPLDQDQLNHFNEHSYTREQFRQHACYKEQKKIDEKIMEDTEAYSKIKMLLL